jgi:hypothetical protein
LLLFAIAAASVSACVGAQPPLAPTPTITPDAAILPIGGAQAFTVQFATVRGFSIRGDHERDWTRCAQVDSTYHVENSIRIVGTRSCDGTLFVTADLGPGRTPLVAAVAIH